jgi:coproporphyrinogen III oxidase
MNGLIREREALLGLHGRLMQRFGDIDGNDFVIDPWQRTAVDGGFGGDGRTAILEDSVVIERGAVLFSHIAGTALPPAATLHRPHLAGRPYEVVGVSVVLHPRNPFAPTAHMNVRCFAVNAEDQLYRWVGGGMDLTPCYLFDDDAVAFHRAARAAAPAEYPTWKQQCDQYFWLKHRQEARGVGGIFFDDYVGVDALDTALAVGRGFGDAVGNIVMAHKDDPYEASHRDWQLIRRGRYAEFNLVWDRGTTFGLQSNGRIESILASMPPQASWRYAHEPNAGSHEARTLAVLKTPRAWL